MHWSGLPDGMTVSPFMLGSLLLGTSLPDLYSKVDSNWQVSVKSTGLLAGTYTVRKDLLSPENMALRWATCQWFIAFIFKHRGKYKQKSLGISDNLLLEGFIDSHSLREPKRPQIPFPIPNADQQLASQIDWLFSLFIAFPNKKLYS